METGRFGQHGGQYITETLMNVLIKLEKEYEHYKNDPEFNAELDKANQAFLEAVCDMDTSGVNALPV